MNERNNVISIVTPSYNQGQYIADTIESVIFQRGDFYIDYIIMDNVSTDNTVDIIKAYENHLKDQCTVKTFDGKKYYVSKQDFNKNASKDDIWVKNPLSISCRGVSFTWESKKYNGQFDAIRQGIEKASGSFYTYINSDKMYLPNAFSIVIDYFLNNPFIHWIKGLDGYFNKRGDFTSQELAISNYVLRKGFYDGLQGLPIIQQESIFWTRELYERVGGISSKYQYAGDYALWLAFAQYENLFIIPYALAGYRFGINQKKGDLIFYSKEIDMFVQRRNSSQRVMCIAIHKSRNSKTFQRLLWPFNRFIFYPFQRVMCRLVCILLCRGGKAKYDITPPSVSYQKIF